MVTLKTKERRKRQKKEREDKERNSFVGFFRA
jgi:hypothetical protein